MISLRKNDQGLGHALVVALVVVVIVAIGVVGFMVAKNHKSTTNNASSGSTNATSSTNTAENSSCLSSYHDANLCHFASTTPFGKLAYAANIQVTNPQGQVSSVTLSADGKGNTSLTTSSNGQSLDSISLAGNTYIKEAGSSTWIEYPAGAAGTVAPSNPTANMDVTLGANGITFKSDGTVACGSLTCYKYQVVDTSQPSSTQYVYFDNSKYLLREWQAVDPTSGTSVMTITYPAVNITAPTPVQSYTSVQ
jgi:hypothetical protein